METDESSTLVSWGCPKKVLSFVKSSKFDYTADLQISFPVKYYIKEKLSFSKTYIVDLVIG